MMRTAVVILVALLAACGQPQRNTGGENARVVIGGGILTVDESVTDVETYLRGLPESEQIAPGIVQHVRRASEGATVSADLVDAQSGTTIGLASYALADENGRTRITLHLTEMSGLYDDAGRQGVLANQILEYLRRDLGDV